MCPRLYPRSCVPSATNPRRNGIFKRLPDSLIAYLSVHFVSGWIAIPVSALDLPLGGRHRPRFSFGRVAVSSMRKSSCGTSSAYHGAARASTFLLFRPAQATADTSSPEGMGSCDVKERWESIVPPGFPNSLGDCVHCCKEKLLRDSQRQSPVLSIFPYQPTNTSDWYFSMISRRTGQ